jgi:hypothetical protein
MGFKERLAAANAKAAAARAEKGTFKEKMAAANAELKTGLAVTKENWDGKRADLAVERAEIREGLTASREKMAAANAELKEGLAETKAKRVADQSVLAAERAEIRDGLAVTREQMAEAHTDLTTGLAANKKNWDEKRADLRAQLDAKKDAKGESFEGVTLKAGRVDYKGQGGPVEGATARVETGADARRRITATRVLAVGVFALAARKQAGHVFLSVEGPGFEFVVEVPVKREADARGFAARINNAAKA